VLALNKQTQACPETKYTWNWKKTSTQLWVPLRIHLAATSQITKCKKITHQIDVLRAGKTIETYQYTIKLHPNFTVLSKRKQKKVWIVEAMSKWSTILKKFMRCCNQIIYRSTIWTTEKILLIPIMLWCLSLPTRLCLSSPTMPSRLILAKKKIANNWHKLTKLISNTILKNE